MANNTSSSFTYLVEPRGVVITRLLFEAFIALAGILGNILVWIAIVRRPKLHTPMNAYLLSLATADLGVLLFNYPIAVAKTQSPLKYLFGKVFCLYISPATETFFGASIWSITAIAVERHRNIVGACRWRRQRSLKPAKYMVLAIWLASFAVASLPLYVITDYINDNCVPIWPDAQGKNIMMQAYIIGLTIVWYALPLAVITYTYLAIKQRLRQSVRFRRDMRAASQARVKDGESRQLKWNKKAARILSPLVILFAITMLPITVLRLLITYVEALHRQEYFFVLLTVAAIFVIINSAVNPVVYYIVSKEFRLAFQELISRMCTFCWQPFKLTRWRSWSSSSPENPDVADMKMPFNKKKPLTRLNESNTDIVSTI